MANGTIAFDTLTTSDQVNTGTEKSIDTSYLFNGSAKAWATLDADASSVSIFDSFNTSSNSDDGAGKYGLNFANNMSNALYMANTSTSYSSQSSDYDRYIGMSYTGGAIDARRTTSEVKIGSFDSSYADTYVAGNCIHGDLA